MPQNPSIFSIGHSNRTLEDFIELLRIHGVNKIADIRKMPRSRANPQFNTENLAPALAALGMGYVHLPLLTGFRKGIKATGSNGWRNPSFKAYAFYMLTPEFNQGLDELLDQAQESTVAMMCSEAVWWRCHRRLVADALLARGIEVRHILSQQPAKAHELTPMAEVVGGVVHYREDSAGPEAPREPSHSLS
ncbi:DUF488 domain-containing protein [Oligoflexus tunisiensis]|uniref:DUF488 domain-containing protein n=1 Tax=Oligoflexus tunisiensis TaxID=708132 RepID=UPI000B0E597F|nr:DUF488 domain-containing protein [Oligoflexus tunisiensis]